MMKIVIFIVILLHSSEVTQLQCSGYIVHRSIQRSVRIKQLQELLKSDHWLQRYCILSVGIFNFLSHPVHTGVYYIQERKVNGSHATDVAHMKQIVLQLLIPFQTVC